MSDATDTATSTPKAKHTPGPWTVADYKTMNTEAHVIRSPELGPDNPHPVVASVVKRPGYSANARLIAAAPDLLAACEAFVSAWDTGAVTLWGEADVDNIRAALSKARGL